MSNTTRVLRLFRAGRNNKLPVAVRAGCRDEPRRRNARAVSTTHVPMSARNGETNARNRFSSPFPSVRYARGGIPYRTNTFGLRTRPRESRRAEASRFLRQYAASGARFIARVVSDVRDGQYAGRTSALARRGTRSFTGVGRRARPRDVFVSRKWKLTFN